MTSKRHGKISRRALGVSVVLMGLGYLMLRPVYNRAVYSINVPVCANHLKQIGLAVQMYARDSNDTLPPVFTAPGAVGWAGALQPYLKHTPTPFNKSPYECPFDATRRSDTPAAKGFSDYWYNANVMQRTPRGIRAARLTNLSSPTQIVLVGCGGSATPGAGFDATYNICGDGKSLTAPNQTCAIAPPGVATFPVPSVDVYADGTNMLFADGHVKAMQPGNVLNNGAAAKGKATFSVLVSSTRKPKR